MVDEAHALSSFSFFDAMPVNNNMQPAKPWQDAYHTGGAADNSGFDHVPEVKQIRDEMMQDLQGQLSLKYLPLAIEPHPGAKDAGVNPAALHPTQDIMPHLVYQVYDERALWNRDDAAQQLTLKAQTVQTIKIPDGQEGDEEVPDVPKSLEDLLPPWCDLLYKTELASDPISDLSVVATKYLHAKVRLRNSDG